MATVSITTFAADTTASGSDVYSNDKTLADAINGGDLNIADGNVDTYTAQNILSKWYLQEAEVGGFTDFSGSTSLQWVDKYVITWKQDTASATLKYLRGFLIGAKKDMYASGADEEYLRLRVEETSDFTDAASWSAISPMSSGYLELGKPNTSVFQGTLDSESFTVDYSLAQGRYYRVTCEVVNPQLQNKYNFLVEAWIEERVVS